MAQDTHRLPGLCERMAYVLPADPLPVPIIRCRWHLPTRQ